MNSTSPVARTLVDEYGPDTGLRIQICGRYVLIDEAYYDSDEDCTVVGSCTAELTEVLTGPHRGTYLGDRPPFTSQTRKIIAAALSYIGFYGAGYTITYKGYQLPTLFLEKL